MIKIEVPFNRSAFINTLDIILKLHLRRPKIILGFFLIITAIAILLINFDKGTSPPIYIYISIAFGTLTFNYFVQIVKSSNKYRREVWDLVNRMERCKMSSTYEFSDDAVNYTDYEKSYTLKWSVFTHYKFYAKHVLLYTKSGMVFAINETNFADEDLERLKALLGNRLQRQRRSVITRSESLYTN